MASIAEQISGIRANLPEGVTLVCVSKFQPVEAIREAYEAGERHFGESRVQELQRKVPQLPNDICWHFIGHLQTNKVRDLMRLRPYLIQSVDSERLLQAVQNEAAKMGIVQKVLLEVHVAKEEAKSGFRPDQIGVILDNTRGQMPNISIQGLMTMATNTDDEAEIRRCFNTTKALLASFSVSSLHPFTPSSLHPFTPSSLHPFTPSSLHSFTLSTLSMGMSDDYRLAVECGSTMVRIGSSIFGERTNHKLRAVFFDQDGVLFNSMPYHAKSWEMAMQEHGMPFRAEDAYRNEGRTGESVIVEAMTQLGKAEQCTQEFVQSVYQTKSNHFQELTGGRLPEVIPGIQNVLDYLHAQGVQCWVVTGSGQRSLIENLQSTFHNVFTGIITAFDVAHGKPHPEPYLKAWERCGFRKEECWVVENAPLGVRAGKAAGLFTIAVNTGPLQESDLREAGADVVLPNMQALLTLLRQRL